MQRTLQGIANRARVAKDHRFGALYGLLNETWLRECWPLINKKAAAGVDRVTAREYEKDLAGNIRGLVERLKKKTYRARLVRRKEIPKGDNKVRALGIPAVEDKLLQTAVAQILLAIYEQDFLDCSYGYRPGIGPRQAIQELTKELQFGCYGWVVEADIKGYFDHIDHEWLLTMLEKRINDKPFLMLIRKWLKAGILTESGEIIDPNTGTPQGGIVSPVLANIYLHHVLDEWFDLVVKPRCEGRAYLNRYADDFVAAFQYKAEAEAFFNSLGPRLDRFGLELSENKTRSLKFSRFNLGDNVGFTYLGFEIRWMKDRGGQPRVTRRTGQKNMRRSLAEISSWIKEKRHQKVRVTFRELNTKLRGHYEYYGLIGNSYSLWAFEWQVMRIVRKWLNRRSQRQSYTWSGFQFLCRHFRLVRPYISERRPRQLCLGYSR